MRNWIIVLFILLTVDMLAARGNTQINRSCGLGIIRTDILGDREVITPDTRSMKVSKGDELMVQIETKSDLYIYIYFQTPEGGTSVVLFPQKIEEENDFFVPAGSSLESGSLNLSEPIQFKSLTIVLSPEIDKDLQQSLDLELEKRYAQRKRLESIPHLPDTLAGVMRKKSVELTTIKIPPTYVKTIEFIY